MLIGVCGWSFDPRDRCFSSVRSPPAVSIEIMAVFMLNVCKFNGCGLTFKSLGHLIQHIEETHIDYDPHVVEQTELQQPTCIPLSYALRFLTDAARKEGSKPISQGRLSRDGGGSNFPATTRSRNNAATPTGSEAEEGDEFVSEPEDSNDSWTTSEEFSADFILRYGGSRVINPGSVTPTATNSTGNINTNDKPFACPVPGCKKRYKNVNGIKYHSKNGHKNDGKIRKAFRCPCGKSYKTPYGLKNHASVQHAGTVLQIKLLQNNKSTSSSSTKFDNNSRENSPKTVPPLKIVKQSSAKPKISAIEDHGYMKSDKTIYTDVNGETTTTISTVNREDDDLGILTPASTPPLSSRSPGKMDNNPLENSQHPQEQLSSHKYLANVVGPRQNSSNRRDVVDDNAY